MSLKKIEKIKSDKGFKIWDLIIYGILIALIVALFIAFVFTSDNSSISGIKISYLESNQQRTVFTYNFEKGEYEVLSPANIEITDETEDTLRLTFFVDGSGEEYNKIVIDKKARCVWVEEANCSNKDCIGYGKLKTNSQFIACSPHGYMVIEPMEFKVSGSQIN